MFRLQDDYDLNEYEEETKYSLAEQIHICILTFDLPISSRAQVLIHL